MTLRIHFNRTFRHLGNTLFNKGRNSQTKRDLS